MTRSLIARHWLSFFLLFVPCALFLDLGLHAGAQWVFLTSALAIIPLAGWMGRSTEQLAERVGAGLGALLNATFGNAAELIIAVVALRAGLYDLVKASITGSIIGNVLLVFGLAALLGGLRHPTQRFNRTAASLGATMLVLSAIGLVVPALFHLVGGEQAVGSERSLSLEISVVLMITYVLSLVFALKTHPHLYMGAAGKESSAEDTSGHTGHVTPSWSFSVALGVLLGSAALVGVMSELLVGAVEGAAEVLGMSEVFVGVILVALIGNAAEHSTAVLMAMKNKMDLAMNIAVGSSIQIALFVAPLLVFLSYVVGPGPMDLRFTTMEVVAVALSVGTMALISQDGESHWMEGVQLLAVYVILGLAFFFLPG
jgi:Ca2+:H+ antiporter